MIKQLYRQALGSTLLGMEMSRVFGYSTEYFILGKIASLIPGTRSPKNYSANKDLLNHLRASLFLLLKDDVKNITQHGVPLNVLKPHSPAQHFLRVPRVLWDGIKISKRKKEQATNDFTTQEAKDWFDETPEYFQRNYHFQTDGYLSSESARLYEHQVELLFLGAADPMRRLLLKPLKDKFGAGDGKGLKFLELGAGTGRLTEFVHELYPKAQITSIDVSDPYLKLARSKFTHKSRVEFIRADASDLPFKDSHFDAVFSCFLFHELPSKVTRDVFSESKRVLRDDGFIGLVDSAQLHDDPQINEVLENFPKDFHEPFFLRYIKNPIEGEFLSERVSEDRIQKKIGFLSKCVWVDYNE